MASNGTTDDRNADAQLSEPPVHPPVEPPPPREPEALTTAARLVLGTASLGIEAITSRLQSWGRQPAPSEPVATATPTEHPESAGSVADLAVALTARGARTAASIGARGAGVAARGLRAAEGASDFLGKLVPDFLNEPMEKARERASQRMRTLGAAGRDELARSQAVAREAFDDALDAVFARLADSRELQFVIRTQSVSAAEQAVDGIRNQTARIDDRMEGATRRLLRRKPRVTGSTSR